MLGMWKVYSGVRNGRVRMRFDEGGFRLEAECWNRQYDEEEFADDLFDPVDSDDEDAAQLRCTGTWRCKDHLLTLHFESVEQVGPGKRLPLKAAELHAAVGKDLGKCIFCDLDAKVGLAFALRVGGQAEGEGRSMTFEAQ